MLPEKNYGLMEKTPSKAVAGHTATAKPEENSGIEKFWEKPENVLRLIDLIFFFQDERDNIPS